MNTWIYSRSLRKSLYRLLLMTRWLGTERRCRSFGLAGDPQHKLIEQIYVINLDRQVGRWHQILNELRHLCTNTGRPLGEITTRFPAVDGRSPRGLPHEPGLQPVYSLADQFFVDPNHLVPEDQLRENRHVEMTRPEIAVAMSHIAVWKLVARARHAYALILEDDCIFRRRFARSMNAAWDGIVAVDSPGPAFDVLYLSYRETQNGSQKRDASRSVFRPAPGLWQLSGYVLSKRGAERLLKLLPVRGPVDLWINQQFDRLDVLATNASLIEQRLDNRSDNSYSILPVLSKVGAIDDEGPSLFEQERLPSPVFAAGHQGAGLTSLATALSMLGYRCCSDIEMLPREVNLPPRQRWNALFNAYVNAGPLDGNSMVRLATAHKTAKFIILVPDEEHAKFCHCESGAIGDAWNDGVSRREDPCYFCIAEQIGRRSDSVLLVPSSVPDKWQLLCRFLGCRYPANPYPLCEELGRRRLSFGTARPHDSSLPKTTRLKFDTSPWIMPQRPGWRGLISEEDLALTPPKPSPAASSSLPSFDFQPWVRLNDTFPSNMALFRETNVSVTDAGAARLSVRREFVGVRDYTAAAITSRATYRYGRFSAAVKPASVPGLITGVFLHRNTPRQEIDVEFLGRDTTKMLINVYYNPGIEGTKFDYGYRGTPVLIDLGFDAGEAFHHYSIEWRPISIRWFVDGRLVHERAHWNPTPVPHLPMRFYLNIWPCRSEELVGGLSDRDLPAHSEVESARAQ